MTLQLTDHDCRIYETEIRPHLPDRLFDAHCHLILNQYHPQLAETMPLALEPGLGNIDLPELQSWWRALFPDIQVAGMVMGFPTSDADVVGENQHVASSIGKTGFPFAMMVRPETPAAELEAAVNELKPAVLKPYLSFVRDKDPAVASITDLITEEQIAVADRHRLAIMLHVSKPQGMADPDNLDTIARLIRDYPRCRFILAHCGRCFISPNMEAALARLPVAANLWLDTSAVCDPAVFLALLSRYDRSRILYGSDLVTAAGFRGSYVRLGLSWHACTAEMVARKGGMTDQTTFAAYENLCALCFALRYAAVTEDERHGIFYRNACDMFPFAFTKGRDNAIEETTKECARVRQHPP